MRTSRCRPRSTRSLAGPSWLAAALLAIAVAAWGAEDSDRVKTPFVRLLATPEKYEGSKVMVRGFASVRFERDALFLSEADSLNGMEGIWLSFGKDERGKFTALDRRYVVVVGVFSGRVHGHMGAYEGEIKVERMVSLSNPRCPVVETGDPAAKCGGK